MTMPTTSRPQLHSDSSESPLLDSLRRMGIVSAHQSIELTPLAGGVSSDIYRAQLPNGVICIKRALAKLKVAADWRAPVERRGRTLG